MDRKQTPDTPWHISFVKKDESDPRRHKARCFYYQKGECHCVKSANYTSRCPGSSHCNKYTEDEVQTHDIRELQAERKRAEQYHEKMIKKRIELEQQLGEPELYTRYGKVLECPVCGGRLIKNRCNYCGFIRPEHPRVKKDVPHKLLQEPIKQRYAFDKKRKSLEGETSKGRPIIPIKPVVVVETTSLRTSGTLIRYIENGANFEKIPFAEE